MTAALAGAIAFWLGAAMLLIHKFVATDPIIMAIDRVGFWICAGLSFGMVAMHKREKNK